jgi:DNA-binding response OmpR family regulator
VANSKLLILDDDPQIGRVMEMIAGSIGFEARSFTRVARFFHTVEAWRPTHIALDLVMPDASGAAVMAQLAAMGCQARIIVTSGVGAQELDAAGRSGGDQGLDIAGVLAKPFSPRELRLLLLRPDQLHAVP